MNLLSSIVLLHNVLTDEMKKLMAFKRTSPFLVRFLCVSALYKNSSCSSGDFCARSENASASACWVATTWWKCVLNVLDSRRTDRYFRCVSRRSLICASSSVSVVLLDFPSFSSISWRVHLYVEIPQFFSESILVAPFLRNSWDGLSTGENGVSGLDPGLAEFRSERLFGIIRVVFMSFITITLLLDSCWKPSFEELSFSIWWIDIDFSDIFRVTSIEIAIFESLKFQIAWKLCNSMISGDSLAQRD